MKKAMCAKCHKVFEIDETLASQSCPYCHEPLVSQEAIKLYYSNLSLYRRKGDLAFEKLADYKAAYNHYAKLYELADNQLGMLISVVVAKLRCSNLDQITIKEATDILIKGSDKVEITYDNVTLLSDFLVKMREDSIYIVNALKKEASNSNEALSLYHKALNEYTYYLKNYLDIYKALDKMNKYFKDSEELLNDEIKKNNESLKEKNEITNSKKNQNREIFKNKRKEFYFHISLYAVMAVGFILSIVGLILFSANRDNTITNTLILVFGLIMFIGGYFLNHYLTYTKPKQKKNNKDNK